MLNILPCAVPCAEAPLVRDPQRDQGAHKGIADQRAHKGAHKALCSTKSMPVSASECKVRNSKRQWAHKAAHKDDPQGRTRSRTRSAQGRGYPYLGTIVLANFYIFPIAEPV